MESTTSVLALLFSGLLFYWICNVGVAWNKVKERFHLGYFVRDNFIALFGSIMFCVILALVRGEAEQLMGVNLGTKIGAVQAGYISPSLITKVQKLLKARK